MKRRLSGEVLGWLPGTNMFIYVPDSGGGGPTPPQQTVPVAVNDTSTTEQNTSVTILPLVNDTHPDGEALTIVSVWVSANEGSVENLEGSSIRYTPAPDFLGTATIFYAIRDLSGDQSTAGITVTVTEPNTGGPVDPEAPVPPVNTLAPSIPTTTFYIGYAITADNGAWDNNPDTFQYSWSRDGSVITDPGADAQTYFPTYKDFQKTLSVSVTGINEAGSSNPAVSNTTDGTGVWKFPVITNYPPSIARPVSIIGGEPAAQSRMLAAEIAQWAEVPDLVTRQWYRDGVAIAGATDTWYVPVAADVGTILSYAEEATFPDASTLTSSVAVPGAVTNDIIMEWGALTKAGYGEYLLKDHAGTPLTTVVVTGGTLDVGAYVLAPHELETDPWYMTAATDGAFSGTDGQTVTVTSDQGAFTFRVLELANGMSFKPEWPANTWEMDVNNKRVYTWRSELNTILQAAPGSPEDEALSGVTLWGRHGTQGVHEDGFDIYPEFRAWTENVTIQSHDMPRRPIPGESTLIMKAHRGAIVWGSVQRYTFKRLHWVSEWNSGEVYLSTPDNPAYVNSKSGHVILNGDYGWLEWTECDIDGEFRTHVANLGAPYYGNDYTYNGFIYSSNGSTPKGPLSVTKCSLHDFWRSMHLHVNVPGLTITDNDIHHCAMDSLVLTRGTLDPNPPANPGHHFARNNFFNQIKVLPPEMTVLSIDIATSEIEISDPDQVLLGNPTMNFADSSVVMPTGSDRTITSNTDLNTLTIGHTAGVTTLKSLYVPFATTGTDVKIRLEPAHADYFQCIMSPDEEVKDIWIYNNTIHGYPESGDPENYDWPQGFFFEDISGPTVDNFYTGLVFAGNLLYTAKTLHGISLYNPKFCMFADNTVVTPGSDVVNGPYYAQIGARKHWSGVGKGNLMVNNIADRIYNYIEESEGRDTEHVIWTGDYQNKRIQHGSLAASDIFSLSDGRSPSSFEGMVRSFRRKDQSGVIDYLTRYSDLPSTNTCTLPTIVNNLFAVTGELLVKGPYLINDIKDSAGNLSRYGIQIHVQQGFFTEYMVSSDAAGLNKVFDWGTDVNVVKNGQYIWMRSVASGNPNVLSQPRLRLGKHETVWSIFSYGLDVWKPTLDTVKIYNRSATDALLSFATDEDNGRAYWVVDQTPSHTALEIKLFGSGFVDVRATGVQDPAIKIQELLPETSYYAHICHEDGSGNLSDPVTVQFATTGDVIFHDAFNVNTLANYSLNTGSVTYDAELEAVEFLTGTGDWDGIWPTAGISLPGAGTYYVEALVSNEDGLGIVDMICGSTPGANNKGGSSNQVYATQFGVATIKVTVSGPEVIYPKLRFRGTGKNRLAMIMDWKVTAVAPYTPIINKSAYGKVWDNPVGSIPYLEDLSLNPFGRGFAYPAGGTYNWKSYQTELTYTQAIPYDYFSTPLVKLMPGVKYRAEMVAKFLTPLGAAQLGVGRKQLTEDLSSSLARLGSSNGVQTLSTEFTATPRRYASVSALIRAGEYEALQMTIYGFRVSEADLDLLPLTLEDVSTNASDPPATLSPVNVYLDDASVDGRASLTMSSLGQIGYVASDPRYDVVISEPWEGMETPAINVINDGSMTYRATAVVENRTSAGAADLVLVQPNGNEIEVSETRAYVRERVQCTVTLNPNNTQLKLRARRRGGVPGDIHGVSYLRLDEINHSVINWSLFDKVFPDLGLTSDTFTCRLRTGYGWADGLWAEEKVLLNEPAAGLTRAQMRATLKSWLDELVIAGFLSAATDVGDSIVIAGSPLKGPLLEPRFTYKWRNNHPEGYDPLI